MARFSTVHTDIDFDQSGKQTGYFNIPHSPHEDAWGATRIPICVIANGSGPTAILMGGNHGDEYEGPITLGEMIRDLDPAEVSGRLIILPALNLPAVRAGRRTSPVDGLNLNRTFPGNPAGSLSEQITAWLSDVVFPLGDAMLDLHSGGSSLSILPSAVIEPAPDPDHFRRNVRASLAFDAPLAVIIDNLGEPRTSTATSVRAGMTTVGTEMAGGGGVTAEALAICRRGVRNVLAHLGILAGDKAGAPRHDTTVLRIPGPKGHVFAGTSGVFEAAHPLGARVSAGDVAGRVHDLTRPWNAPETLYYQHDGIVYGHRQPGRVEPGNCCAVVAAPYEGELP